MLSSSLFSFLIWLAAFEILSLPLIPILSNIFPRYSDRGYGLTKAAGFLFFGLLSWLLASYLPLKVTTGYLLCIVTLMYLAGFACGGSFMFYRRFFSGHRKQIIRIETLFLGSMTFFCFLRALNPEIFWGEKPMDSALLHFFLRNETLPATDPWSSGNIMRYYYLGSFIFGSLLKLTGIEAAVGYNLAVASVPALCLISLYSAFNALSRKPIYSGLAAVFALTLANPEILKLVYISRRNIDFDTFWAATRLFTSPGFTEYPLWSFLFADLHAHVISQVSCALLLGCLPGLMTSNSRKLESRQLLLIAVSLASLILLNTWDFLVYGVLISITLIVKAFTKYGFRAAAGWLLRTGALMSLAGLTVTYPYMRSAKPSSAASWGWNGVSEYNTLSQILSHFGFWFALILLSFFYILMRQSGRIKIGGIKVLAASLLALCPIFLGMISHSRGLTPPPWGVLILSSVLIQIGFTGLMINRTSQGILTFASIGILTVGGIFGVAEIFFLIDRMNTVFKVFNSFWLILASSALSLLFYLFQKNHSLRGSLRAGYLARFMSLILLIFAFYGGLLNIYVGITHKRTEGPRLTLNGQAYLRQANRSEFEAINWLNSHIHGNAVILEAQGNSYGPYTRIVMHTGLSTVLGWDHHVKQRGTSPDEVAQRKRDIEMIYKTRDVNEAEKLLEKYEVDLIFVGELERKDYGIEGINKFLKNPAIYPLLFRSQEAMVFTRARRIAGTARHTPLMITW